MTASHKKHKSVDLLDFSDKCFPPLRREVPCLLGSCWSIKGISHFSWCNLFLYALVLPDGAEVVWGLLAFDGWSHLCPYMHTRNQARGGRSSKGRYSLHYNDLVTENSVFTCSWDAIRRLFFWIRGWRVFLGYYMTLQLERSYFTLCVSVPESVCQNVSASHGYSCGNWLIKTYFSFNFSQTFGENYFRHSWE